MRPDEVLSAGLNTWLAEKSLAGLSEAEMVGGFCERLLQAGLPLARAIVLVDTLHPVHEGRAFRWSRGSGQAEVLSTDAPGRVQTPRHGGVAPSTTCSRPTNPCCAGG
jgi:hypothetical protein